MLASLPWRYKALEGCLTRSLAAPPRGQAPPSTEDWELNRGRVELRTVTGSQPTDPEEVAFPTARQIVALNRRVLRDGEKMSNETVHLITRLEPEKASSEAIKKMKRDYWKIESALHYRLDTVLDEDRSRVRNPKAALVLGIFRRLALSFAMPWIAKNKSKTNARPPKTSSNILRPTIPGEPLT